MAKASSVWGIDVGQCALKAIKLSMIEGEIQVDAFEVIEHPQILSQAGQERATLIHQALEQLQGTQSLRGCKVAISVPGQSSLVRFVKLPPVEKKRVPDIVRFEAEQQIPFPIDEVIWEYQTFQDPDSPDVEVGIFAMKRVDVAMTLANYNEVGMNVDLVQMAPLSLYNFMTYDGHVNEEGATILADVGADKTDLVVHDGARIWARTIQIGGNNFTEALVRAFKLSFDKAEKLKRTAASSKYARQIFQAMRPVFADLVQEIQRSVGYYTSLHRDTRFKQLVGLGNGFRLPGLQKFLEQNLNIPVHRVDSYNNLAISDTVNAAQFSDQVLSFAVAYGLALQGLGAADIDTNLLPMEIVRKRQWDRKRPWFAAAAAILLACLAGPIYRANEDAAVLQASVKDLNNAKRDVQELKQRYVEFDRPPRDPKTGKMLPKITQKDVNTEALQPFKYQTFWPSMETVLFTAIDKVAQDQPMLVTYAELQREHAKVTTRLGRNAQDSKPESVLKPDQDKKKELEAEMKKLQLMGPNGTVLQTPQQARRNRKVIIIEGMTTVYYPKLDLTVPLFSKDGRGTADIRLREGAGMEGLEAPPGAGGMSRLNTGPTPPGTPRAGAAVGKRGEKDKRGFVVCLKGRTHMGEQNAVPLLLTPLIERIRDLAGKYPELEIVGSPEFQLGTTDKATPRGTPRRPGPSMVRVGGDPEMMAGRGGPDAAAGEKKGPEYPDPLFPDEDMVGDTHFELAFRVAIAGDGVTAAKKAAPENPTPKKAPGK